MKTLKFTLKRRKSGKAIKKEKRFQKFHAPTYHLDENGTTYVLFKSLHRGSRINYRNRVVGKKYPATIYQLEDQHRNMKPYSKNSVNYGDWYAFRILNTARNETQKKRVYKLYPKHDPKYKRQKEHEQAVKDWKEKLQENHENQLKQNYARDKRYR